MQKAEGPTASARILVVDDDPLMRSVLSQSLQSKGYSVVTAENGRDALNKLSSDEGFAAVLLDLDMPVLDGIETLAHIKRATPDLPVIVLTAKKTKDVIEEARALGAFDYILKPPDMGRVATLLAVCTSFQGRRGE